MSGAPDNLAFWNAVTPGHVASPMYRTEDFRAGACVIDPVARDAVGDVAGLRLLHLQCHFGLDTLSLARLGARAVGLDFSPAALSVARALAAEAGLEATFVESDVLSPPPDLAGFDIVFASWGAIWWIDDIAAWMRTAASALRPGGRLVLVEGHPALLMLDEEAPPGELRVRWPYRAREPHIHVAETDYAGVPSGQATRGYFHGLADILGGALAAGLEIRRFEEGDRIPWRGLEQMERLDRDYFQLPGEYPFVPHSFTLEAVRSG